MTSLIKHAIPSPLSVEVCDPIFCCQCDCCITNVFQTIEQRVQPPKATTAKCHVSCGMVFFSRGSCTTTNPTGTTLAHLFHRSKWVKNRALDVLRGAENVLIPSGLQSFILAVRGARCSICTDTNKTCQSHAMERKASGKCQ